MNDLALRIALTGLLLLVVWALSENKLISTRVPPEVLKYADWSLYAGVGLIFVAALTWLWVGIDL